MKDIVIDGEREILTEVGMGACKGQNIIAIQFHLLSSNRSCETNNMEGEREKTKERMCIIHCKVKIIIELIRSFSCTVHANLKQNGLCNL